VVALRLWAKIASIVKKVQEFFVPPARKALAVASEAVHQPAAARTAPALTESELKLVLALARREPVRRTAVRKQAAQQALDWQGRCWQM
jgi:hypothetical protein